VGRVHVLDEICPGAVEHACVDPGGIAIVEADVGVGRTAEGEAPKEIKVLALGEAPTCLHHQECVGPRRLPPGDLVVAGLEAGRSRAPQVLQGTPRHPEQEQEQHGKKTELERYRKRLQIVHCSMSKAKTLVPRVISSPGDSRALATRRPLTLTPLVELRSTICQSPTFERRSSACRREMLGSSMLQSASLERPSVAVGPSRT